MSSSPETSPNTKRHGKKKSRSSTGTSNHLRRSAHASDRPGQSSERALAASASSPALRSSGEILLRNNSGGPAPFAKYKPMMSSGLRHSSERPTNSSRSPSQTKRGQRRLSSSRLPLDVDDELQDNSDEISRYIKEKSKNKRSSGELRLSGERVRLRNSGERRLRRLASSSQRPNSRPSSRPSSPRRSYQISPRRIRIRKGTRIDELKAELRAAAKQIRQLQAKVDLWEEHKKTCTAAAQVEEPSLSDSSSLSVLSSKNQTLPSSTKKASSNPLRATRSSKRSSRLVRSQTMSMKKSSSAPGESPEPPRRNNDLRTRRYSGNEWSTPHKAVMRNRSQSPRHHMAGRSTSPDFTPSQPTSPKNSLLSLSSSSPRRVRSSQHRRSREMRP